MNKMKQIIFMIKQVNKKYKNLVFSMKIFVHFETLFCSFINIVLSFIQL